MQENEEQIHEELYRASEQEDVANIRRILKKKAVFDCLHSKEVDVYDWTREELMSKKNSPLRKPKPIRSSEKKESIVSETLTPLQTYQCAYLSYPISVTRSRYSKEKIVSPKKVNLRLAVPSKLYRADIVAEHWKTDYGFAPLSAPGKRLQLPINFIRNMDRKRMDKSKQNYKKNHKSEQKEKVKFWTDMGLKPQQQATISNRKGRLLGWTRRKANVRERESTSRSAHESKEDMDLRNCFSLRKNGQCRDASLLMVETA